MELNYSLLFYLKKPKNYTSGNIPIYMRFTVDGIPKECATTRTADPERWCSKSNRENGKTEITKSLNSHLDDLQQNVHTIHAQLVRESNTEREASHGSFVFINSNQMNTITSGIVRIEQPRKPAVLKYEHTEIPQPGEGEVLISQKAIGVNFLDVFFRNGTFPMPAYPALIGLEAAGIVEQTGDGVKEFAVGDRVAYYGSNGAYSEKRILPAKEIFKLPYDISYEQAASIMIKGMTAHMLLKQSHELKAGEVVLILAMTGGVGTLISEWARSIGATVIGTVGSIAKKDLALTRGFDLVIDLSSENFAEKVKKITDDKGIDVFYDSIGVATFQKSLELVKPGGSAVLYGWASGMPEINTAFIEQRKINFVQAVLNHYPAYQDKSGKACPRYSSWCETKYSN